MIIRELIELLEQFSKDIPIKFYDGDQKRQLYFVGIGYNGGPNMETKTATECTCCLKEKIDD